MDCLDTQEKTMVAQALEFLHRVDPPEAVLLEANLARVTQLAAVAASFPSLVTEGSLGPHRRSAKTLLDTLCHADAELGALSMPMRAVMGEAFMIAKTQLFRAFRMCLRHHEEEAPPEVFERAGLEVAQSIYTMLLGELLWDLVRSADLKIGTRQRAATELVRLWESPDKLEVDDFFPVLEAVWRARNRVRVTYGTLMGTMEFFQLMREDCPPFFVSYFTRQDVSTEDNEAFQEFLFGLSQEDLQRLREAMTARGVQIIDPKFAADTLGLGATSTTVQEGSPEALYYSYRRRQRAAQLRRLTGTPGPQRTAEAYLILHLLEHPALEE